MSAELEIEVEELPRCCEQLDTELSPRFQLPHPSYDPVYADGNHLVAWEPDAQRLEQVMTHLQLLGYLPEAEETSRDSIEQKLKQWEEDYIVGKKRRHFRLIFEGEQLNKVPWEERRFRILKAMATFEGEVFLRVLPPAGQVTLVSRIAHMRLKVYGLSRAISGRDTVKDDVVEATTAFGEASIKSARIGSRIFLAKGLAPDPLQLLNLLGHAPAATDLFLSRHGKSRYLFEGADDGSKVSLARFVVDKKPKDWELRWEPIAIGWTLKSVKSMSLVSMPKLKSSGPKADRKMFSEKLSKDAELPINIVALELLQLRLWMLGYYQGEVDGKWGALTEESVQGFVLDHKEAFRNLDTVVRAGWRGWRVVNLYRIFAFIVDYLDVPAERLSITAMNDVSEKSADLLDDAEWKQVEGNYIPLTEKRELNVYRNGSLVNVSENKKRKRYFGWRRLFSAVGSFFRTMGTGILVAAKRVAAALKQGLLIAYNIFKYLWQKVRLAVRVARLAVRRLVQWIFGKPFGTAKGRHLVMTQCSLDFDTVLVMSKGCPGELQELHADRLDWMSRSLSFMCDLGLIVVSMLKMATGLAWFKVAYTVFKRVRSMIANPDYRGLFSDRLLEQGFV